jgi:transcriptional regulator with XRE-family HTH domain
MREWSQNEMANRLNISVPAYSKIETGLTDVRLSRLEQLAQLFNCHMGQLLTIDGICLGDITEFEATRKKLIEREVELMLLQKRVIQLYQQFD